MTNEMLVTKRNGTEVAFNYHKIEEAVQKAVNTVPECRMGEGTIRELALSVQRKASGLGHTPNVEEIQDLVIDEMMNYQGLTGMKEVTRNYMRYRYNREVARTKNTTDDAILALIERDNEEVKQENSNKNPTVNSVQRDYMAGEVSKDLTYRYLLPPDIVEAHKNGIIHFHDSDYFAQHMHNCDLVDLEDMLQNGTVINDVMIDRPKSFETACTVASQIVALVASSQYGGQTITAAHLAPFVDVSRRKIRDRVTKEHQEIGLNLTDEQINKIVEKELRQEVKNGCQTIQYQLVTLMTTNGQAPFVSVLLWINEVPEGQIRDDLALIIEVMLEQRILGVKNKKGEYITPAFPKLLYVTDTNNITKESQYWYLTRLSAECSAKRMVPDYISAKKMREYKNGDVYACMGCRSFLTPDTVGLNPDGSHKYYGRFNQGVVTLNLVDVACSSMGDEEKFWELMEERTELCKRALMYRHKRLLGTPSDVAPILWQHGALARLQPGETIDKLLYNNYSTISLGYAGLCECTRYMKGVSHTDPAGKGFALQVMQFMNDKCAAWRAETNISFSLYGTPLESTTYKFAKALQRRFGIIPGVTDKGYITNSYHVHVTEKIDWAQKLKFEAEFQALSPGGAISYVELPDMAGNIDAVLSIIQFMYENIMYAELNSKSDYCHVCGSTQEIKIVPDANGKLIWECPVCGNRDQTKMNVARRTCGYIGTQFWNQGRTNELLDRYVHVQQHALTGAPS